MRKTLLILFALPSLCFAFFNNRQEVLKAASEQNQPIVAVFLGGEGCPWSHKIEKELFNSLFFQEEVGSEALLWQIALSRSSESSELEQQYNILQFPSILLLDPNGKE